MIKQVFAAVLATVVSLSPCTGITTFAAVQEEAVSMSSSTDFNPQTVMWTNNPIENVLDQSGIYKNAAEINPNDDKNTKTTVSNPYGKKGDSKYGFYNFWEYAEYCWTNFYPIGNGRMAGMVAGGIDKEVIQINEDTCWDGSPYGTLKDENGNVLTTIDQTNNAEQISTENQTSGSITDGWRYFRGADANGNPAAIGSSNVLVGDETFRTQYPSLANKSISNLSVNMENSHSTSDVQNRWTLHEMVENKFLGNPQKQRAYKSFAEVYLDFGQDHTKATNYTKSLDMETGIVSVEYDYEGSHMKRESFASYPDQVVVTHVQSDNDLNFSAQLHTYHNQSGYFQYTKVSDREVKLNASVYNGSKNNLGPATVNAIKFEAHMFLDGDGAFSVSDDNSTVSVNGGKEANIYVVGATNYVDYLNLDNAKPSADCLKYSENVKAKTYSDIKNRHLEDFTSQFSKTELSLSNTDTKDFSDIPTEKRVRKDVSGASGFTKNAGNSLSDAKGQGVYSTYADGDNNLATLEFNYGKYLLISGAREGRKASGDGEIDITESQPLNLTGKWNAALSASWNGKYTVNINTEMNYWAAQPLGLTGTEKTLIDTFDELAQSGSITAANQYAVYNDRGDNTYQPGDPWVMHHNYDLWRGTQPIDNATAGLWPTGGIWLLDHAWQYYQYNKDTEYLAEVYPYMIGAAKFFTQFLVVDPKTGYLITAASCSPEQGGVQPGPAMDTQLIRNLYDTVQKASEILGKSDENANLLSKIADQMPSSYLAAEQGKVAPNIIDSAGLINEWARFGTTFDFTETTAGKGKYNVTSPFSGETVGINEHSVGNTNTHRHCSHLWEMYPGTHLSAYSDDANEQKIYQAFKSSVTKRAAGEGKGWCLAWRMSLSARALDGNTASSRLNQLLSTRTSPNLMDQHPNFQIDGNYGATAGIIEMLVQSHDGTINLLPALPSAWSEGSFKGINTREGATVDLSWSGGKPKEAKLHANETGDISVRTKYASEAKVYDQNGVAVKTTLNSDRNLITFSAVQGNVYTINNFGTNISEGTKIFKPSSVTEFFASDGGSNVPKLANSNTEVGYLYRRPSVRIGYAVSGVQLDKMKGMSINMPEVRVSDLKMIVTIDSQTGTEIVNQYVTAGENKVTLQNTESLSGTHKLYIAFIQDPYDTTLDNSTGTGKYLGNAGNLTVEYGEKNSDEYTYNIKSAVFTDDGKVSADIEYVGATGEEKADLMIVSYNNDGAVIDSKMFEINGTQNETLDYTKPEGGKTVVYIWNNSNEMIPLSATKEIGQP